MKRLLIAALFLVVLCSSAFAGWVNGYSRRDGTYVQGHQRSDANDTVRDNYSYAGNTNPYTGERGSNYYRNDSSSEYYGTQPSRRSSSFGDY